MSVVPTPREQHEESVLWAQFAAAGCARADGGSLGSAYSPAKIADQMLAEFKHRFVWRADGGWVRKSQK